VPKEKEEGEASDKKDEGELLLQVMKQSDYSVVDQLKKNTS